MLRHPQRSDYEPTVKAFLPTAEGLQLELRCSLLLMRDGAVATKPIACEEAWSILDGLRVDPSTRPDWRSSG